MKALYIMPNFTIVIPDTANEAYTKELEKSLLCFSNITSNGDAEVYKITQFNPLKTDNVDDILDLLVYLNKVIEQFGAYIINMGVIISQETDAIPVRSEYETCPF